MSKQKSLINIVLIGLLLSFLNDATAQTITEQISQLEMIASSLPICEDAEKVKKAVIDLAIERAKNAVAVNYDEEATALINDVLIALQQPAGFFTQRNSTAKHLSVLKPLLTETNNPYLEKMVASTTEAIASPDANWSRATPSQPVYNDLGGIYGTRSAPYIARDYFWLFAHEQSPMQHHPELIKRVLRRMHAFSDMVNIDPLVIKGSAWMDQFAVEYAFPAFYEIVELYPNLLLPSQKKAWDQTMKSARAKLYVGGSSFGLPWNYNIETARMLGMLNVGLYLKDQAMIDRVLDHADKAMRMQRQDGAMPYHGDDRPSVNYHNVLYGTWLQIYDQMDYAPLREALEKSQWKGPTTGRTEEWWTSPFDKAFRWNIQKGTEAGIEAVATLTQNPYVRWMIDRNQALTGVVSGKLSGKDNAIWYKNDLPSQALPDNYTIPDRNVGGPRAWYGNFTYAGSFRPWTEGYTTLIGAMTVDQEDGQLNSILAEVTPRIWITPEGEGGHSAWAVLTDQEISATTISKDYSISTSVHGMARARGPYKGPTADWKGRQMWIGLPDRIIGLVSIVPGIDDAKAYAVNGALRLISGGSTGAKTLKELETISPTHYRYGQLDIILHEHTYTSVTGIEKPYRNANLPATELIFSNRSTEPTPVGAEEHFSSDSDFRFVVEVRNSWADTNAFSSIKPLGNQELIGLEAIGENRSFQVWLNTSTDDLSCTLQRNRLPAGEDSFVLSDGLLGRVPYQSTVPNQVTLKEGQHALVIVSNEASDHELSAASFSSSYSSDITVIGDKDFGRIPLNTSKELTFKITNPNDPLLQLKGNPQIALEGDAAFSLAGINGSSTLAYGDTTTFKIKFTPTSDESYSTIVRIPTNVKGNEIYEFKIIGKGGDEIILVKDSNYGTSWELPSGWSDEQAAHAGSHYLVNRFENGVRTLRTPSSNLATFPGESLKIIGGGGLLFKAPDNGIIHVQKLVANSGYISFGNGNVNNIWRGEVLLEESGIAIANSSGGGSLTFEGDVKGDGRISINGTAVTFQKGNWNGDLDLGNGILRFGFDITAGKSFLHNNIGVLDINGQNHVFESLILDGNLIADGVYTASELGDGFIGEGTLTIGTIPTDLPLVYEEIIIENTLTKCTDGIDNDGDGLLDCKDPDCASFKLDSNCDYTYPDQDGDEICDEYDSCPDFDNNLIGTPCDDGDRCTIEDIYQEDCQCIGLALQDDNNNDICDYEECNQVAASQENTNHLAAHTVDGNLTTYWSALDVGAYIEYCLEDIKTLQAIDIAFYEGDKRTTTFDVEVSLDGVHWSSLLCNKSSNGTSTDFQTFTFIPVQAKKIRIIGQGTSIDIPIALTEVRLHTGIYFEAESATIVGDWEVQEDTAASANKYVVMNTKDIDASPTVENALTYTFTVDQTGDYKIWTKKLTPNGSSDSFWIKLDDGDWEVWGGTYTTSWRWVAVLNKGYSLEAGTHTLYVHYRESGAKLDKVCISPAHLAAPVESTVIDPNSKGVYYEAECAAIHGDWEVLADLQASNSEYVVLNAGGGNPTIANALKFDFDIATTGDYHIWARKITPNGSSDSFWIKLDDGDWEVWAGSYTSSWQWFRILSNRIYSLSAGTHTLYVHYRERGAKLDKIYIADTNGCSPEGMEGSAVNCSSSCTPGYSCNDGYISGVYDANCNCLKRQNVLYAKLLLEGFYEEKTQQMHGQLKEQNLLPLTQPFNTAPWNYTGMESVNSIPYDATDWILVMSRASDGTPLSQSVGFITKAGNLVSLNGREGIGLDQIVGNYFSIHHRSHLAIISSQPYDGKRYDFTLSLNQAQGIKQLKEMDGKYLLYAGDYDCSGIINNSDFNYWKVNGAIINQYLSIDGDGNGIINNKDYNLWINNRSKIGESMIRY